MLELLRYWITKYHPLIIFVYGQVFFVVGLVVFLQSRRHPKRELASSLRWLAAFGLVHAFVEWGDLFIPMQASSSQPAVISFLYGLQTFLLAVSFGFLFMSAVDLLQTVPDVRRFVRFVPPTIFALWVIGPFTLGRIIVPDYDVWRGSANSLARYFIGFPSAICSAYALHRYLRIHLNGLAVSRKYRIAAVSGISLAVYGLLSGLVGPQAPFFPADIINSETFTRLLVVPPPVFRTAAALLFMITITRALTISEIETDRVEKELQQAEAVAMERNRTARDLHDGAIQRLYAAGLLVQSLRSHDTDGDTIERGLSRLSNTINELIVELRSVLSGPMISRKLGNPVGTLLSVVDEIRQDTGMDIHWSADSVPMLSAERINHLSAVVRESLSNVVRHAGARHVAVTLKDGDGNIKLLVEDDGRGLPGEIESGYGIRDMKDRARLLNGQVSITSRPAEGTVVKLIFPVEEPR